MSIVPILGWLIGVFLAMKVPIFGDIFGKRA